MPSDIIEPQVLVRFPDDTLDWHHRVLLRRLRDATWIVLTPDFDTEVQDLSQHTLLPLARGGPVPVNVAARRYLFAPGVEAGLPAHHAKAVRLALILGGAPEVAAGTGPAACWRVADTAASGFGAEVGDDLVESHVSGVAREAGDLVRYGEPPHWVFVERVPLDEVVLWEQDKQGGAGCDRRSGVSRRYLASTSVLPTNEAVSGFKPHNLLEVLDWPRQGRRAALDFIQAVSTLGLNL
jgi:hypothetical protein